MDRKRIGRISQEIKKVVSHAVSFELNDPKIAQMTSIVDVKVSSDLSYADIYVTIMGTPWEKGQTLEGLENAAGFIKRQIAREVKIRQIPELRFKLDETIEHGMYMDRLIAETIAADRANAELRGDNEETQDGETDDGSEE